MVFQPEARFQQFIHCNFREHVVRALCIPWLENGKVILVVSKYGKVGIYEPERFVLLHTYLLDLTTPVYPDMKKQMLLLAKRTVEIQVPNCQKTHTVVDATFADDMKCVLYLTTKGILQCYDIGEIQKEKYGMELLPGKSFGARLTSTESPAKNRGHTETHRLSGLPVFSTVLEYSSGAAVDPLPNRAEETEVSPSRLLIGDSNGCVTIIEIPELKNIFGFRKIRGVLHQIKIEELAGVGLVTTYKAHDEPITQLRFLPKRQLVSSSSRDRKASIFIKDVKQVLDTAILSLPKGINTFAHSERLKVIATGSDDRIVRLFSQFVPATPQVELRGHRESIVNLQFLDVSFAEGPVLLSLSEDVELRAWDPTTHSCLQSVYVSFPIKSNIFCKKPEFAHHAIFMHQPNFETPEPKSEGVDFPDKRKIQSTSLSTGGEPRCRQGFFLVLYCNSFAQIFIEKRSCSWPFDFDQLANEFRSISLMYESKLQRRRAAVCNMNSRQTSLTSEEILEAESKLDSYVAEVIESKRRAELCKSSPISLNNSGLLAQVTQRAFELKKDLGKTRLFREGGAFPALALADTEKITFTNQLGQKRDREAKTMAEVMREAECLSFSSCIPASKTKPKPRSQQKIAEEVKATHSGHHNRECQVQLPLNSSDDDESTGDGEIQNISCSSNAEILFSTRAQTTSDASSDSSSDDADAEEEDAEEYLKEMENLIDDTTDFFHHHDRVKNLR